MQVAPSHKKSFSLFFVALLTTARKPYGSTQAVSPRGEAKVRRKKKSSLWTLTFRHDSPAVESPLTALIFKPLPWQGPSRSRARRAFFDLSHFWLAPTDKAGVGSLYNRPPMGRLDGQMDELNKRLITFALNTLAILESNEDWGADTLDQISAEAHRHELSYHDSLSMFRAS